jgi:DNA-binding LytR/AlgR family response regulator
MDILIAEDEPLMMDRLRDMLGACWPQARIVAACADGLAALDAFAAHDPDVAFLDVRMPGLNGLELARRFAPRAHIVFVTAYDQYAVDAFDAGAVDYLVKPIEAERLLRTVERLRTKGAGAPDDISAVLRQLQQRIAPEADRLKWIKATVGRQIKLIKAADILLFQSDAKYTRVVTRDAEAFIRTPLKDLLPRLDPDAFWQVHRSTIVRADAIASVEKIDGDRLALRLNGCPEDIVVSRAFAHLFREE